MSALMPSNWTGHCWALVLLWVFGAIYLNPTRPTSMDDLELVNRAKQFGSFKISSGWPFQYRILNCTAVEVSHEIRINELLSSALSILLAVLSLVTLLQHHFSRLSIRGFLVFTCLFALVLWTWLALRRGVILSGTKTFLWFRVAVYYSPVVVLLLAFGKRQWNLKSGAGPG